jgi:dynein heavy chain 2
VHTVEIQGFIRTVLKLLSFVGRGNIAWDFIHGLLELAIYGGRVDNVFDNRVLVCYLKQCFNPDVINEQSRGSKKLGPLNVPTTTHYRVGLVKKSYRVC